MVFHHQRQASWLCARRSLFAFPGDGDVLFVCWVWLVHATAGMYDKMFFEIVLTFISPRLSLRQSSCVAGYYSRWRSLQECFRSGSVCTHRPGACPALLTTIRLSAAGKGRARSHGRRELPSVFHDISCSKWAIQDSGWPNGVLQR